MIQKLKLTKNVGSLMNWLMANNQSIPEVGKGGTILWYTDRTCVEVLEVSKDLKTVKCQALEAKGDTTKDCKIGHQDWILYPSNQEPYNIVWYRNSWRKIFYEVQFTKTVILQAKKAGFEYIIDYLELNEPGISKRLHNETSCNMNIIPGITYSKKCYDRINILWGRKDYYYDWGF